MAANMQLTTAMRQAVLQAFITAASSTNTAVLYSGTAPADANTALSGNTALATFNLDATIGTISGTTLSITKGGSTINSSTNKLTTTASAGSNTTATFFRVLTGATVLWQGTVGTATSDLILNTTSITSGGPVEITGWTIVAPGA